MALGGEESADAAARKLRTKIPRARSFIRLGSVLLGGSGRSYPLVVPVFLGLAFLVAKLLVKSQHAGDDDGQNEKQSNEIPSGLLVHFSMTRQGVPPGIAWP